MLHYTAYLNSMIWDSMECKRVERSVLGAPKERLASPAAMSFYSFCAGLSQAWARLCLILDASLCASLGERTFGHWFYSFLGDTVL